MIDLPGTDRMTSLLIFFLDTQSRRAQVVASNVANADTPGYLSKEVDFADALRRAAYDTVGPDAAGKLAPQNVTLATSNLLDAFNRPSADRLELVEQAGRSMGVDGNTVDMEHEMATLADAGGQYMTGVQLLQSRLRTLRFAIREGK